MLNTKLLFFSTKICGLIFSNVWTWVAIPETAFISKITGGFAVAFSYESHKLNLSSLITLTKKLLYPIPAIDGVEKCLILSPVLSLWLC